jgi:hypothetical protein
MHCVVCNQQARVYWTNHFGGHHNKSVVPTQLQNCLILVIHGTGLVDPFFQQDSAQPYTVNVTLDILHYVFGSLVLSNQL